MLWRIVAFEKQNPSVDKTEGVGNAIYFKKRELVTKIDVEIKVAK